MEYSLAMINYENELNKLFSGEPQEYVTADKFNIVLSEGFPEIGRAHVWTPVT